MSTPLNIRTTRDVPLDRRARAHVTSRMGRLMKKLGRRAMRGTVRFEDLNGPRGGVDVLCRIKVVLAELPSTVTQARGTGPREAFDLAASHAQTTAGRAIGARRARRRRA